MGPKVKLMSKSLEKVLHRVALTRVALTRV